MDTLSTETRTNLVQEEADGDAATARDEVTVQQAALDAEDHRIRAVASLDHLAAAVQLAIATHRWNSADEAAIASAMDRVAFHLADAQRSVGARAQVLAGETREAVQAEPKPEPAPSAPVEERRSLHPPEGHLVAATRAIEAAKSYADQLLFAFQMAPREGGIVFDALDGLCLRAESGRQAYLEYALARDV